VQAVVIGAPPQEHFFLAMEFLKLGKHVLIEKPMAMSVAECEELTKKAADAELVLAVMHNFQFAHGVQRMREVIRGDQFGAIKSIGLSQMTSRNRRLPVWYQSLPGGLFFDEASHFFYLLKEFGGERI
jgi:scyllo-inositol 2-dehydrogenase (NADP+)